MSKSSSGCNKQAKIAVASGISGLLLAVSAPNVLAQQVQAATDLNSPSIEVVEVVGVRSQLENALAEKRNASSIIDVINANDIDALPALDFGEALQVIPGVQLNNDEEGRQSTISLRGLSGGFVKTTAMGQSFATPSAAASVNQVGSPNPFAAFEAGVFDGVAVIKSPTADLQEGGVAGTVDKKLQEALSKKDGLAKISVGARYEELTGNYDPNIAASFAKHIIEDKLAVAFKVAGSGQTFRRDTFDIIDYVDTATATNQNLGNGFREDVERVSNLEAYRTRHGLSEDAELFVPRFARNVSEYSEGQRVSFSGNIEFQATDSLKVGAHILASERDLGEGTKEATTYGTGFHRTLRNRDQYDSIVTLDEDVAPVLYEDNRYAVTAFDFENGSLQNENRKTTFEEKTAGIIAYADFVTDDWEIDGKITHSEAENNFQNVGLSYTLGQDHRPTLNVTDQLGRRTGVAQTATGFNGSIDTGRGSLGGVRVEGTLEAPIEYNNLRWNQPLTSGSLITSLDPANDNRRLRFGINGRVRDLSRELSSAEFGTLRNLDFGADAFRFDNIKFGGRFSRESLESIDLRQGPGGIDTANLGDSFLSVEPLSVQQNAFFNGNLPGTFGAPTAIGNAGWLTLDNNLAISTLQQGIVTEAEDVLGRLSTSTVPGFNGVILDDDGNETVRINRNRTGFWDTQDRNSGLPQNVGFNFSAEQDITAFYLTTDFSGDLGAISYSGNIGVRQVETANSFTGFETSTRDDANGRTIVGSGVAEEKDFSDDYSHTLPMANLSINLTDDLILRTAYYEGIVRPNLLAQRPTANLRGGAQTARLSLPTATVRPYEAANYDISLEWYNRKGSAITVGFFEKKLTNLFATATGVLCPAPGQIDAVDSLLRGPLVAGDRADDGTIACTESVATIDENGEEFFREVDITTPINTDDELNVEGFEIAIQQNLDFLPYPFNGFGGVVNYTELKQSDSDIQLSRVSPKSYNVVTYWENDGISLRLQYNWRDDQVIEGANNFLGDRNRAATERLDFVSSYKLNKKTKIFFRAYNLTDFVGKEFRGFNEEAVSRLTYTGRIFQTSVNYTF